MLEALPTSTQLDGERVCLYRDARVGMPNIFVVRLMYRKMKSRAIAQPSMPACRRRFYFSNAQYFSSALSRNISYSEME